MYFGSDLYTNMTDKKLITEEEFNFIEKFGEKRIFSLNTYEGIVYINEECDSHFTEDVSKEDLYRLSEFFKKVADNYDELIK